MRAGVIFGAFTLGDYMLFCILGKTGSGKDSLASTVARVSGLEIIRSYTTRPKRHEDEDTHIFATEEDYQNEKNILVDTQIGQYYYWTTQEQAEEGDIYIINPEALPRLRESYSGKIVTIYITAPEDKRRERLTARDGWVDFRRITAEQEQFEVFENIRCYDYCVHNNNFRGAVEQLKTIINFERNRKYAF